jgi:hypothetical protein
VARVRSPNYPALSLPEAIQSITKVFAKENRHRAEKEVVVKAMGYGGVNGASLGSLSALLKYGLLEQLKDGGYKVTERALAILHPQSPQEKAEAIAAAAREPALFAEMLSDFPGSIPSDDNLRSYLVRRGFGPNALSAVINSFRETMALVDGRGGAYDSPAEETEEPVMETAVRERPIARAGALPVPPVTSDPYYINHMPSVGFEGGFRLNNLADFESLIRMLNGFKMLYTKIEDIKPPRSDAGDNEDA